jgi:hypothetical protein
MHPKTRRKDKTSLSRQPRSFGKRLLESGANTTKPEQTIQFEPLVKEAFFIGARKSVAKLQVPKPQLLN